MSDIEVKLRNCVSLEESCSCSGIGRMTAYKEVKAGRLRPKKAGKRTSISVEEEVRWLGSVPVFGSSHHG
jgi:hypothetical protein